MIKEPYKIDGLEFEGYSTKYFEVDGLFINREHNILHLHNSSNKEYMPINLGKGITLEKAYMYVKIIALFNAKASTKNMLLSEIDRNIIKEETKDA